MEGSWSVECSDVKNYNYISEKKKIYIYIQSEFQKKVMIYYVKCVSYYYF